MSEATRPYQHVQGAPRMLLRLEGLLVLLIGIGVFWKIAGGALGWWGFVLFFAPDLSMTAYLAGPRFGALVYNSAHTYLAPAALAVAGFVVGAAGHAESAWWAPPLASLWAAHIGFDRLLGYGLKYPTAFGDTHLGCIGRA